MSASGAEIVARLGCAGCHAGLPAAAGLRSDAVTLSPTVYRRGPDAILEFLGTRHRGDSGGRLLDFALSDEERRALADFLGRDSGGEPGRGRTLFRAFNCAGCHPHESVPPWPAAPDLRAEGSRVREEWLREFLLAPHAVRPAGYQPGTGTRMPDFGLSTSEADSIAAYLMSLRVPRDEWDGSDRLTAREAEIAGQLLRERYACLGCHVWDGEGGRIGPDLTAVRNRLQPSFVRAMIADPQRTVPGSAMPPIPMPAEHVDLLARYLLNVETGDHAAAEAVQLPALPPVTGSELSAAELYVRHCAACHGIDGGGDGYNAKFLDQPPAVHANADSMSLRTDDTLYDGIHAGAFVLNGSPQMPPFGGLLSDAQIRALVAYIRQLCGCTGPAWSTDGRNARAALPS